MRRISITSPSLKPPHGDRKAVPERGTIHEKVAENIQISSSPLRRRGGAAKDLIAKAIRERQETKRNAENFPICIIFSLLLQYVPSSLTL